MIEQKTLHVLKMHLFSRQPGTVFTVLDGASVPDLPQNLALFNPEYVCLYRGELPADMAEVAPYLAILEEDSPFTNWVLTNGWGNHWGIFGVAETDLPSLRRHFRKFLTLYDHNGNSLYFRYYDPRVWQFYVPTCTAGEITSLFGHVSLFVAEGPEKLIMFRVAGEALIIDEVTLDLL